MLLAVAILLPVLLGVAVVSAVFKRSPQVPAPSSLKLSLALGVGLAAAGTFYFFNLILLRAYSYAYIALEGLLGIMLVCGGSFRHRQSWRKPDISTPRWLSAILLLSLIVSGWILWALFHQYPHGGWDAVAIWNLKARYLFAGRMVWQGRIFSKYLAHPDYPLGIPSIVASLWQIAQKDSPRAPFIVAVAFAVATIGLLYSSLTALSNRRSGILAVLTLVSTPFFLSHAEAQYSDIPIAFLFLAAAVLFALHDVSERPTHSLVVLSGAFAGFAAWTKNEGLLFLAVLAAVRFVIILARRGVRTAIQEMLFYGIGAAPCLIALGYFKLHMAPSNDLISAGHSVNWMQNLLDAKRHYLILNAFGHELPHFGLWLINPLPFLLLYAVFNRNSKAEGKGEVLTASAVLAAMVLGYYLVYAIQPLDLPYLLASSLNRLLMQLWPLSLFCLFSRTVASEWPRD